MNIISLNHLPNLHQTRKMRVGRGIGSGKGKTAGRGHKGQKARSGYSRKHSFEGGQTSLFRRIPKSGFTSMKNIHQEELALHKISAALQGLGDINLQLLKSHHLLRRSTTKVKVIVQEPMMQPLVFRCPHIHYSKSAAQMISAASGSVLA
jgi:large subunit ribosomal protein L15